MIFTNDYTLLKRNNLFYVVNNTNQDCPCCSGSLIIIGSRARGLILENGEKITLVIKRYRCQKCKKNTS